MISISFIGSGGPPAFATAAISRKYPAPMNARGLAAGIAQVVHRASRCRHPVARLELACLVVDRIA
jgi:hypothetical protein